MLAATLSLAGALVCPPSAFLETARPVSAPLKKPRCRAAPPPPLHCGSTASSVSACAVAHCWSAAGGGIACGLLRHNQAVLAASPTAGRRSTFFRMRCGRPSRSSTRRQIRRASARCGPLSLCGGPGSCFGVYRSDANSAEKSRAPAGAALWATLETCNLAWPRALICPNCAPPYLAPRAQLVGEQWAQLPADEREPYNEQARQVRRGCCLELVMPRRVQR